MRKAFKPTETDLEVGRRIRVYRQRAKLSLKQVAKVLGLTYQQLQKYEKGINRIAPSRLEAIARKCGVPVSAFMPSLDDRKNSGGVTPFAELRLEGAQALLIAYGKIKGKKSRAVLVELARLMADPR